MAPEVTTQTMEWYRPVLVHLPLVAIGLKVGLSCLVVVRISVSFNTSVHVSHECLLSSQVLLMTIHVYVKARVSRGHDR